MFSSTRLSSDCGLEPGVYATDKVPSVFRHMLEVVYGNCSMLA